MPEMKLPGPDHPITVTADPKRYQVRYGEHVIADSRMALALKEASYKEVLYFPPGDVQTAFMSRTEKSTHCPYKGDASYYTIVMDGRIAEDAVWSYETPYPAMETIRGYLAFYPNQVEIYEVEDDAPADVRDAILHTDDGAGSSQKEAWKPTVGQP